MSWVITGQGASATNDPYYFSNVSLLLLGDGTNGSTTIVDSSPTPKNVTPFGNAQISTVVADPFDNNTGVISFDGSDWITAPANSAFSFGTADFTVEMFAYWNNFSNLNVLFDTRNGGASALGFALFTDNTGVFTFYPGVFLINSSPLSLATWYHIAVTRSDSNARLFINGIQQGSTATLSNNLTDSNFFLGKTNEGNFNFFNGYIDDLRITKGIARYTSNFTPPIAPFPDF